MPEALQEKTNRAAAARRASGSSLAGGAENSRAAPEAILNKETMRRIGYTIAGKHWQADVAQMMEISKSQMTRWLNGSRNTPPTVNILFEQVLFDRLLALADCLAMPGMPRSAEALALRDTIHAMAEPLKIKRSD